MGCQLDVVGAPFMEVRFDAGPPTDLGGQAVLSSRLFGGSATVNNIVYTILNASMGYELP